MKRKNKLFASYFEENKTSILIIARHLTVEGNYYVYNRKTMREIFIFAILEL